MPMTPTPPTPVAYTTRTTGATLLAQASTPITVTGVTATVTLQAEATGGAGVVGAPVVVFGATAIVVVSAGAGTATITNGAGSPIAVSGATATVSAQALAGSALIGTPSAGDPWQIPTLRSNQSGSITWSTGTYTTQTNEPTSSGTFYRSRWFKFTAAAGELDFTATAATSIRLDVFDVGGNFSDPLQWGLIGQASGTTATVTNVFPDSVNGIYVRVSATTDTTYDITLTHSTTVFTTDPSVSSGTGPIVQVYDPTIEICPASVTFAVFNLVDDETVTVRLSPNPLAFASVSMTADDSGIILGESYELPGDLPAGTYTLLVDHAGGTASDTFIVENSPILHPADDPNTDDDALADDAPPAGPFTRWTFHDPYGVMPDFEFTYNPERMTSPYVPRTYIAESTTSPAGQAQVWEALSPGTDWEFAGYLDSEAELNELMSWLNVNRRFWCIDHRQRKWVIALVSIDPQPKRVFAKPYATSYTAKALLFKEYVEP